MKKIVCFIAAICLAFGLMPLSGCGLTKTTEEVDKTKTQLYVSNYNGGQGTDWLDKENSDDDIKGRFEEAFKDVSFEEGKTGVQIMVSKTKEKGSSIISQMDGLDAEVFFSEEVPYYAASSTGRFLDISDVISDIAAYEGVSFDEERLANISVDGKYYALPNCELYQGISYDVDLFEDENLYFADDKTNGSFVQSKTDIRSKGPDGEYDTFDDGLPATVDEFFELCDYMVTSGITPMVWSGQYPFYFAGIFSAFNANYMSAAGLMADYTYDSKGEEIEIVTEFNAADQPIITKEIITPSNGYLMAQSAAKYYALDFMKRLYSNSNYYYSRSTSSSVFSHYDAQETFVKSKLQGGSSKPIAMLADGNWWYNEAQAAIKDSYSYGSKAYNRRFGYMPIPTAQTETQAAAGKQMKLLDYYNSYAFVKSSISPAKIALAKEFLKFCYTLPNLQQYTLDTGLIRGLTYEMSAEQIEQMPYESQQLMNYRMKNGSYAARSLSGIYLEKEGDSSLSSTVNGLSYDYPTSAYAKNISAKDYFMGMWSDAAAWSAQYGKYF